MTSFISPDKYIVSVDKVPKYDRVFSGASISIPYWYFRMNNRDFEVMHKDLYLCPAICTDIMHGS